MTFNAFPLTWNNNYFYTFPPFSLVGQVLVRGAKSDKTEAVAVIPDWSTQNWYPQLMQMTSHEALFIRPSAKKSDSSTKTVRESSTTFKTPVDDNQGNVITVNILEASLRQSAHCKYNNYI